MFIRKRCCRWEGCKRGEVNLSQVGIQALTFDCSQMAVAVLMQLPWQQSPKGLCLLSLTQRRGKVVVGGSIHIDQTLKKIFRIDRFFNLSILKNCSIPAQWLSSLHGHIMWKSSSDSKNTPSSSSEWLHHQQRLSNISVISFRSVWQRTNHINFQHSGLRNTFANLSVGLSPRGGQREEGPPQQAIDQCGYATQALNFKTKQELAGVFRELIISIIIS